MKTSEQLVEEMKALGIDLGAWGSSEGGDATMPVLNRQGEALVKLRVALEGMVAKDLASLGQLREQMERLEHGGGS
jgi:hypothetical protein